MVNLYKSSINNLNSNKLSDALGKIRVAAMQNSLHVFIQNTLFVRRILKLLYDEGLIMNFVIYDGKIKVFLKRDLNGPIFKKAVWTSTQKRATKQYVQYRFLERFGYKNPNLVVIISTRYGLTTFKKMVQRGIKIGGELICVIEP